MPGYDAADDKLHYDATARPSRTLDRFGRVSDAVVVGKLNGYKKGFENAVRSGNPSAALVADAGVNGRHVNNNRRERLNGEVGYCLSRARGFRSRVPGPVVPHELYHNFMHEAGSSRTTAAAAAPPKTTQRAAAACSNLHPTERPEGNAPNPAALESCAFCTPNFTSPGRSAEPRVDANAVLHFFGTKSDDLCVISDRLQTAKRSFEQEDVREPEIHHGHPAAVRGGGFGGQHTGAARALWNIGARGHRNPNIEHYSKMAEWYTKKIKPPCLGDKWGCDEKHQKVRGRELGIVAVTCAAIRFVLALDMSPTKEKYGAAPLLRAATDVAGGAPRLFITDGLKQYHTAFKKACRMARGLMCWHIRNIHIQNRVCNTNTQERLNGEFADRFIYAAA